MRKLQLEELERKTIEEFKESDKLPVVVVLDRIRSGMNVGSIFRSADSLAIEKIILGGFTPKPPHREITKTAIGATQSVEWQSVNDTAAAIRQLKDHGYMIIGVEQTDQSVSLQSYVFDKKMKVALVFGNEVEGLSEELLPLLDLALEIPQYGTKHSFNVAVCAGIILWECNRQLRKH